MFATGASSISFLAIPALTYATNSIWVLPLAMMVIAFLIQGWVIFPLLRRIEITSTYEYLERRFNRPLRYIASAQAIVFQTLGRTSVVLVLPALALSATSGIDVFWAVVIMGVVTTAYTAIGGFEAVIWTDVLQGILMFAAPLMVIGIVWSVLPGGAPEMLSALTENNKLQLAIASWDYTLPAAWILCLAALFQHTVSLAGDQPVIQRVFSTPMKTLRRSAATYITCGILIGLLVNAMGLAIFAYFHRYPEQIDITAQGDQLVPVFLVRVLPAGLAGLIVAAAMSTVSSTTNSVATLLHQDFYLRFFPGGSERTQVRFLKISSCVVGLIGTGLALFLATRDVKSMFVVWNMVAGLLGSGVVGVFCLGMFTRRANASGAIIGAVTSIGVNIYVSQFTDIHWSAYVPLSLVVCVVVGYIASLPFATPEQSQDGLTVFTPAKSASAVLPGSLEAGTT
jgi:SSS family transporter